MGLVNGKEMKMGTFGFSFTSSPPCCVSLKGEAWFCMCVYVFLLCVYCVRQTPAPLHVNYVTCEAAATLYGEHSISVQ